MENSFERHRARRRLFATDAAGYEDGRPGYPREVFDTLTERCGPLNGSQVLEIGPGTGQATGPLLDAGATVTAVELGVEMATSLAGRHENRSLEVIVGPFEDVALPTTRFDLVVAATSFHWIDPEVALPRCGEVLRPGGWLALWWHYFGEHTPAQTRRLFGSFSPFLALAPDRREPLLDEIEQLAAGEFGGAVTRPYLTPIYTAPTAD